MKPTVVDASVVAAALFRERYSAAAKVVLVGGELYAPDLIFAEMANVIWKRHRRGEINATEAVELLSDVRSIPLHVAACEGLAEPALAISIQTGHAAYDSIYVALAVAVDGVVATADERLVTRLFGGPFGRYVRWIGQRP